MRFLKNLFSQKVEEVKPTILKVEIEEDIWHKIEKENKPFEVVLVACDTYDCGWVIDTAWWLESNKCWMSTGSINNRETHLPYTHWRKLPQPPKDK